MMTELFNSTGPIVETIDGSANGREALREAEIHEKSPDSLRLVWDRRRLVLKWILGGAALSLLVAICVPNQYESTVRLMPPDQMNASMAMLAATTSVGNSSGLGALAGDLLGIRSTSALFVAILEGSTVQDDVIDKFGLRRIYADRFMEDARNDLRMNTSVLEDRRSGIITIRLTDKNPRRAAAMAGEYVEELNRLVNQVNTSSAHRERVFLEGRLEQVKVDLESAEKEFSEFASKKTAIDVPAQGKAMIEAAATLEGEFIATETDLESLKQIYADGNVRVRAMQARADELQRQLAKLGGNPSEEAASANAPAKQSVYPSIRSLPLLGVSYADLYRNTKVQEAIFETLTREYELAKVEEAKETPSVKVVDPPQVPEKKSYPHRLQMIAIGTLLAALSSVAWIVAEAAWERRDPRDPRKMLSLEMYRALKGLLVLRSRNGLASGVESQVTEGFPGRPQRVREQE